MEIYGICSKCLQDREQIIPLAMAKQGERLVIQNISGGSGARGRLLAMGLRIGDEIEVITNNNEGQLAISADFKRYVLGRGLAQKIMTQPVKS
jgi:Fur family ferric uptake transcriptional regulator